MRHYTLVKEGIALAFLLILPLAAKGTILDITDDIQTYSSLSDTTVNMSGRSELHITSGTNPIPGCQINLNSSDSWFFLEQIKPSVVVSTYLSQVQVNGSPAVLNSNVRVVEYVSGAVVIPHSPSYMPLQIYSGYSFSGSSQSLGLYTYYKGSASLGALNNAVSSFKLKRGYMAAFAQNDDGTGISKTYIAQVQDVNISVLPEELDNSISFIRVFPWRWVNKKGWCGGETNPSVLAALNCAWNNDWDNVAVSSLDTEYIPMRHDMWWNAYSNINSKQNSTAALAFNEPDSTTQANMTVAQVIEQWPNLVASGLRLGSPATTDGGLTWLYNFIDQADALNYRVDFVAVHFYKGGWTASQLYTWLREIHERTGRPLWVTEFNNGANWTCCEPTLASNAVTIGEFIDIMDNAPFVERYSVYNWVGATRELVASWDPIVLNPAGVVYRDNVSPMAYVQPPTDGAGGCAYYQFSDNTQDSSMYGNHGIAKGGASFTTGHSGKAIDLDGVDDYIALPANLGDSADFTFAAWVYWDGGNQWQRIFDFGRGTTYYMFLSPQSGDNTLRFAISTTSYNNEQRLETTQMATGLWVHLAVTISGNTGKLFVNGSLVNTNTSMTLNPSNLKTTSNYLGRSQFLADPFFNGRLDDVRIADYALTDAQIAALASGSAGNFPPAFTSNPINKPAGMPGKAYNGSLIYNAGDIDAGDTLTFSKVSGPAWLSVASDGAISGTPGFGDMGINSFTVRVTDNSAASDNATLNITVSGFGLRTHYKFENNANDSIGSKHGTVTGSAVYTTGRIGQAIDLDAVDDYVTLPAGVASTDDITIAAWVNWDGGGIWQRIFDFGNNTSQYMLLTPSSYSNTLRFAITTAGNGGEQRMETTQLATGQWVHVAVTLEGNVGKLYVGGVLKATNSSMTLNPSDFNPAINYIGDSQWSADPLFNGRIDDFRIYNYALPAADIATLATGAANNPPYFTSDPISNLDAIEDEAYSGQTLAASAVDLDGDTLTFSKVNGPVWLAVASNGSLSGTPSDSDTGNNVFTVRVEDTAGLYDTAGMTIDVANIYSGVRGMEDLAGFAVQWLTFDCTDTPACDGADLDGDADVDFFDFAQLANNWLAGRE